MKEIICIACGHDFFDEECENYICPHCAEKIAPMDAQLMAKIRTAGTGTIITQQVKK